MKILYLNFDRGIPVLGDKGASVHVREFVRAAAALGHQVLVVCAALGEGNAPPPADIVELPLAEADAGLDSLRRELCLAEAGADETLLGRELARLAYDRSIGARVLGVLEARGFKADFIYERHALFCSAGAQLAARLGCRRILEVNAPLADEQKRFRGLYLEGLARRMEADSFGAATAVIAVSEPVKRYVQTQVPRLAERIHVMVNGVDLRRFDAGQMQRARIRAQLGVDAGTAVIGFVGSFKPWHGTEFLFDVYRELAAVRRVHLLGVGDGPQWNVLRARVSASACRDSVTLTGRMPHEQIPAWTAATDIVVAPYQAAADFYFSPLKVIEALACARPVVAPRLGQLTELIDHGRTGLLYEPEDARACREAIERLLTDAVLRRAMGRAARASVAERGWERIVRRVAELGRPAAVGEAA